MACILTHGHVLPVSGQKRVLGPPASAVAENPTHHHGKHRCRYHKTSWTSGAPPYASRAVSCTPILHAGAATCMQRKHATSSNHNVRFVSGSLIERFDVVVATTITGVCREHLSLQYACGTHSHYGNFLSFGQAEARARARKKRNTKNAKSTKTSKSSKGSKSSKSATKHAKSATCAKKTRSAKSLRMVQGAYCILLHIKLPSCFSLCSFLILSLFSFFSVFSRFFIGILAVSRFSHFCLFSCVSGSPRIDRGFIFMMFFFSLETPVNHHAQDVRLGVTCLRHSISKFKS